MTSDQNTTDFFDGIGEGGGAPGAVLKTTGDAVRGEITRMFKRDYVAFGKTEPEKRDDGSTKQQLVIILQTDLRDWAGVSKVPFVDPKDESKGYKSPSDDDGQRAIYVPEGKNIQYAIGRAVQAAGAKFEVGGTLAVRIFNLKDTGKGQPLKEHEALYTGKPAVSAGDAFLGSAPAAAPAPTQQPLAQGSSFGGGDHGLNAPAPAAAPAAAPAQDPWATPAAPAQAAAPAAGDPWATPASAATSEPPF